MIKIIQIVAILFGIIAAVSTTTLIIMNKSIRHITKNLEEINETKTNKKVTLLAPNCELEKLAKEINITIDKKRSMESEYQSRDLELRRSIANISHDLRTPLTSIIGYMELIKHKDSTEEDRIKYSDVVLSRAKSLQLLVTGFFDLSRLEAGEYNFELKPCSLQNIICEQMASFYDDFVRIGIEPSINVDENATSIIADENAVRRIFSNLIQNILKHGSKFVTVELTQSANHITTTFTNGAPGLLEEDVAHLFERFYTADRMRSGKNTGLGLAITKSLAEQMGAKINVELKKEKLSIIIRWRKKNF